MSPLRRRLARLSLAVALAAAGTALLAGPAAGARGPYPAHVNQTMSSAHFQVHYTVDALSEIKTTPQKVAQLLVEAERAYTMLVSQLGYPAPLSDGDGRVDVYVVDTLSVGALGIAYWDGGYDAGGGWAADPDRSSGWIELDPVSVTEKETIAHELYRVIQGAIWATGQAWLTEATAEWAGYRHAGYPTTTSLLDSPWQSLDCYLEACGGGFYEGGGYARWVFFQFLEERHGHALVREVYEATFGRSPADPVGALEAALAARGTSLSAVYGDFALTALKGSLVAPSVLGKVPAKSGSVFTGVASGPLPAQVFSLSRLASHVLELRRGAAVTPEGPCYVATLRLTVRFPAGLPIAPALRWTGTADAVPLAVSGGTATAEVPWSTCASSDRGLLLLPNLSTSADAQELEVTGALSVDTSRIDTLHAPPQVNVDGAVTATTAATYPPQLKFVGPQVIRLAAGARLLPLALFASGEGRARIELAGRTLATVRVRPGYNSYALKLPVRKLPKGRTRLQLAAGRSQLAVTSLSADGRRGAVARTAVVLKQR